MILSALVTTVAFAVPAAASNKGTLKVHDDEEADPDQRNEPHVSCDFWVEGFNMVDDEGRLVFHEKDPTGDDEVTPTGDDLDWEGTLEDDEETYHFLNGPYQLPPGHYKVESFDHGEQGEEQKAKSKVFWVDECEKIPFFPGATFGALALLGCVGAYTVMRRKS